MLTGKKLIVIAGCNGSGKSTFSNQLTDTNVHAFDYDAVFKTEYNKLYDSELREQFAHQKAYQILESNIQYAIENDLDFAYETNFDTSPDFWPAKFRQCDYETHLYFFCLNTLESAEQRVQIRVENGGHYVPKNEIKRRFFSGYQNLVENWNLFDLVLLFDTSKFNAPPTLFGIGSQEKLRVLREPHDPIKKYIGF